MRISLNFNPEHALTGGNKYLEYMNFQKMMNRIGVTLLTAVGIFAFTTSCKINEDPVDEGPITRVSLYHASPNAPNLDIFVDDEKINNVPFEYAKFTDYLRFSSGNRNLKFRTFGGTTIAIDTTITLEPDQNFSLFVIDEFADASVMLLFDDPEPPTAGNSRIRFINLSPDSQPLQLKIKDVALPLTVGQSFTDASSFMNIEAKTYDFEITSAGTTVLELPGSQLQSGWFYTIYVIGYVTPPSGNTNTLSAQVVTN